jgi:hypothetical protein
MRKHWRNWNEYQRLYKYHKYWTDDEYKEKIKKYNLNWYHEKKHLIEQEKND